MITSAGKDPQVFVFALGGEKPQATSGESTESTDPHADHKEDSDKSETDTSKQADTKQDGNVVEVDISAKDFEFSVEKVEAKVGDTVRFNLSSDAGIHGLAIDEFGMKLKAGGSFEFKVTEAGEHQYYCSIPCGQGHDNMSGTLVVTE